MLNILAHSSEKTVLASGKYRLVHLWLAFQFIYSSMFEPSPSSSLRFVGVDGVPLPFVVKFMKLAFNYEQWEVFEVLLQPLMTLLKTGAQEVVQTPAFIMTLQLLASLEPFFNTSGRKQQKKGVNCSENTANENLQGTEFPFNLEKFSVDSYILSPSLYLPLRFAHARQPPVNPSLHGNQDCIV